MEIGCAMLRKLIIKNFAIIDELELELHEGFNIMTGETGAGKSIILGALGLLLGQRFDSKNLKNNEIIKITKLIEDFKKIYKN